MFVELLAMSIFFALVFWSGYGLTRELINFVHGLYVNRKARVIVRNFNTEKEN